MLDYILHIIIFPYHYTFSFVSPSPAPPTSCSDLPLSELLTLLRIFRVTLWSLCTSAVLFGLRNETTLWTYATSSFSCCIYSPYSALCVI